MSALNGKHALVTGAGRGIGAAIAQSLSGEGASVSLMVRNPDGGEKVARSLRGAHAVVIADITDRSAVQDACRQAAEQLGPVDILVNNAGSTESAPFLASSPSLFERMIAEHLLGAVYATQAVLPAMIERKRGHVVNIASTAGLRGEAYVTAYVAAKHALVGLTKALAVEVAKHGISVNAVCPGYTDTDLVRDAVRRIAAKTGRGDDDALHSILARAGQARLVTVDEVAAAVLSLCTAPAGAASGQTVVVDGTAP
ncbi:MAG TPA: SDR family NAD(P)-dependent oxidoreductase [Gemmatimonadaceae bacterium]